MLVYARLRYGGALHSLGLLLYVVDLDMIIFFYCGGGEGQKDMAGQAREKVFKFTGSLS